MAMALPVANTTDPMDLCAGCGIQPRHFDGYVYHDFCGKTCASGFWAQMCPMCKSQPRYFDGKTLHPYCGRTCAARVPGNKYHGKHKITGIHQCLKCGARKAHGPFCSQNCSNLAIAAAPIVLPVPNGHPIFQSVENQFKVGWKNGNPPQVRWIYKVVVNQTLYKRYEDYRAKVEKQGKFTKRGRAPGNENRRWHGTQRNCTLGDNGNAKPCGSPACPLCNIITISFDTARAAAGAFGRGVYSSSTSSKSHYFSRNGVVQSNYKAMFLTLVVVGKVFKTQTANNTYTAAPAGSDSVLYDVTGSDELIVYNNDAIRPSYLLIYDG